ncbi:MAG: CPBP family intramembrane metalloprotease [Parachlamydiales bacterium]|nr:CPBP family intramembrane metalloprotease [Parachlamydiales bacterium]
MSAIPATHFRIPLTNYEFTITAQQKKVVAVALASLALFVLQLSLSIGLALLLTAVITVLTHFCPRNDTDWFNTQFDLKTIGFLSGFLILKPLIIQAFFWALGIPLPPIAQEGIAEMILSAPWKMIPLASIVAPFSEEILFRGFLLERLEDLQLGETLSMLGQSFIFGAVHLNKSIQEGMQIPVFAVLSFMGYIFGRLKKEENSLLAPMAIHSANNIGACVHVLLSDKK